MPSVNKAIREFVSLPEQEPIITVLLGAFLLNHVASREVNIWLNIIAPQGEGKTELLNLFIDHPSVWKLPDRLSQAYFFSSKGGERSALRRLDANPAIRLLMMSDLATLTESVAYQYQGDIYTQLLSIHDGHFKTETGLTSSPLEYGPKAPNERLGWIAAGTESFYEFFNRRHRLGTRFLLYYMDPSQHRHWTDTTDLESIQRAQPNKAETRRVARETVHQFLDAAIRELDGFEFVKMNEAADARLAAASRFVSRIMGAGHVQDSGTRRSLRVRELCRMFAFMQGHNVVREVDVDLGIRILFSQLTPDVHRVVRYILQQRGETIERAKLLAAIGSSRKLTEPVLTMLTDIEVLKQPNPRGSTGYAYTVTADAMKLIGRFDHEARLFAVEVPAPVAAAGGDEW